MMLIILLLTLVVGLHTEDLPSDDQLTLCPGHVETLREALSSNECESRDRVSLSDVTGELGEQLQGLFEEWKQKGERIKEALKKKGNKKEGGRRRKPKRGEGNRNKRSAAQSGCVRRCTPSCKNVCTNNCYWDCDHDDCGRGGRYELCP